VWCYPSITNFYTHFACQIYGTSLAHTYIVVSSHFFHSFLLYFFFVFWKGFFVQSAKALSILVPEKLIKYSKYKAFVYRNIYNLFLSSFSDLILRRMLDFDTCFTHTHTITDIRGKKGSLIHQKRNWDEIYFIFFIYSCVVMSVKRRLVSLSLFLSHS